MPISLSQENREARIKVGDTPIDELVLKSFTAVERLSEPFTIVADVLRVKGSDVNLARPMLGSEVLIEVKAGPARSRRFHGRLWAIEDQFYDEAGMHFRLTIKPWASFLDLNIESRIYQNKKVEDIAKDVTDRRGGMRPKMRFDLRGKYPEMEYTVQWQESDFDFISRLYERHGIYYYFEHSASAHELVAVDNINHHTPVVGVDGVIKVLPYSDGMGRPGGAIWRCARMSEVVPYGASVRDFDFETPNAKLSASYEAEAATELDKAKVAEVYVFPGGFTKATGQGRGTEIAARLTEATRVNQGRMFAEGDVFAAAVGHTIEVGLNVDGSGNSGTVPVLIAATTHTYVGNRFRTGNGESEELRVTMELLWTGDQFRPAMKTPRPRIYGPQTAIVAGSDGEEIETDKYGRIKVHFHWDRVQDGGATSSCWIRVAQSVAGRGWGAFTLPRIGQEVVVEFLNGDPDAPLVTGAVYNGENGVPYPLPANKTRSTYKTRSSPKSSGFNELRFEDKAGSEEVFFRAEKDLNSVIDKGHETRKLNSGNRTTQILKGDETLEIVEGKRTETIYGNETLTIKDGNRTEEITKGNDDLTIKMGNRTTSIDMGNDSLTIKMGNQTIKINMGKQTTEAMQAIELKCGGSTFKMTPASIEMKSMMIKIEGSLMFETKGLMMKQEASALHIVKGALVMIN